MARKKKDKGMMDIFGGGLMLGVGVTALPKLRAPPSLSSAMVLPTQFASIGVLAKMGTRTLRQLQRIPKRRR